MSRPEPKFKPPGWGQRAHLAMLRCRHCKGKTFTVNLDVRNTGMLVGDADELQPIRGKCRVEFFECTACGEPFYPDPA